MAETMIEAKLSANSRIGVIGGGPSGAMTAFFLLEMAERLGLSLTVDLYESRHFTRYGPSGCNMCAGVVSESLIQTLAAEGIPLPSAMVIQRGIDSYVLHTSGLPVVTIDTPVDEVRIAAVYRGGGPRKPAGDQLWSSFDHFLLEMARHKGANILPLRVTDLAWDAGRPKVNK
jgi:flavin-dependent dehydrogenase